MPRRFFAVLLVASVMQSTLAGAVSAAPPGTAHSLTVTATAYNALPEQTDGDPNQGAWGDRLDRLKPGLRAIAVSRDLLKKGLTRGRHVRIKGLKGEFVVLDKMPAQWTRRIDIFMGRDLHGARRWGVRRVKLTWTDHG
jgi:3D (Asp-Asp-Asp) domain-containing protein